MALVTGSDQSRGLLRNLPLIDTSGPSGLSEWYIAHSSQIAAAAVVVVVVVMIKAMTNVIWFKAASLWIYYLRERGRRFVGVGTVGWIEFLHASIVTIVLLLLRAQVNSASYPQWDRRWVVAYGLRREGLVWLIGVVVCLLAADHGANCSLARATTIGYKLRKSVMFPEWGKEDWRIPNPVLPFKISWPSHLVTLHLPRSKNTSRTLGHQRAFCNNTTYK